MASYFLRFEERETIARMLKEGYDTGAIGIALNRSTSTIQRELTRKDHLDDPYCAQKAQKIIDQKIKSRKRMPSSYYITKWSLNYYRD